MEAAYNAITKLSCYNLGTLGLSPGKDRISPLYVLVLQKRFGFLKTINEEIAGLKVLFIAFLEQTFFYRRGIELSVA